MWDSQGRSAIGASPQRTGRILGLAAPKRRVHSRRRSPIRPDRDGTAHSLILHNYLCKKLWR